MTFLGLKGKPIQSDSRNATFSKRNFFEMDMRHNKRTKEQTIIMDSDEHNFRQLLLGTLNEGYFEEANEDWRQVVPLVVLSVDKNGSFLRRSRLFFNTMKIDDKEHLRAVIDECDHFGIFWRAESEELLKLFEKAFIEQS